MKKILALTLAVLLVLAMGVGAMADDEPAVAAIDQGTVTSEATTLTIPKTLLVKATDIASVYNPQITYTFTIAPVEPANHTVSDGQTTVTLVKDTEGAATLTDNTAVFNTGLVSLTSGEATLTDTITVSINVGDYSRAGVYRYEIEDTTLESTLTDAGIVRKTGYDDTQYLDVYVNNGENGLVIAGYALHAENGDVDGQTTKSSGFNGETEDEYQTYNVTLSKQVAGTMGDKTHEFPFDVTAGSTPAYFYGKNTTNLTDSTDTPIESAEIALKHGDTLYIRGLSPNAVLTYTETNDTTEEYTVTCNNDESLTQGTDSNNHKTYSTDNLDVTNYSASSAAGIVQNDATVFINTLNAVSPTGVVLRFAPYIIMAGIAVVLLVLASRRRKDTQDKSGSI